MPPQIGDSIDQLARVDEVNYPEFTSKLIADTFDAIVSSMIRQQEAYADLVERIAMTLEDFSAEAVTDSDVSAYLRTQLPGDGEGGTSVGSPSSPGELDADEAARLESLLGPEAIAAGEEGNLPGEGSLEADDVALVYRLVRLALARPRLEALRELVSQGLTRIVVEDGTIETELEFRTYANVHEASREGSTERSVDRNFVRAGALQRLLAIDHGSSRTQFRVSTGRDSRRRASGAEGEIRGRVRINFRGEPLPSVVPAAEAPETGPVVTQ
jgi:hypothetical protein